VAPRSIGLDFDARKKGTELSVDEEFKDIPISDVEIMFNLTTIDGKQVYSTAIQYSRPPGEPLRS
jgi:hypothetical protein